MPLIGTAGHVDHGKSTLIQRLTGRDPDRWEAEKRRGLTIDLGFAWAVLSGGIETSFVDVPGHQRFARNMLAGVEAVDAALLVVAADEGWMPQSEEHLAVLDLLDIKDGVVALTKSDLVDAEALELASLEVRERLEGTSLATAPIVPVSSLTGSGIGELESVLARLAEGALARDLGRPRLWVDRVFSAAGAGLVVTGSLLDGRLAVGDTVSIQPSGERARVRSIQSHETVMDEVGPGRRVALNLAGLDRDRVGRGDLVGLVGQWRLSDRFVVSIRPARYLEAIDRRGSYQLHIGSGAHPVTITGLDSGVAMFRTGSPLPMMVGDHFILRDSGRRLVVAGGRVLDPAPGATMSALAASRAIDPQAAPDVIATALLDIRRTAKTSDLAMDSGGGRPLDGEMVGDIWLVSGVLGELQRKALELVEQAHHDHPLRGGIPISTLARRLGVPRVVVERIVEAGPRLERRDAEVALIGRQVELGADRADERDRVLQSLAAGLDVPTIAELGVDPELLHLMARQGQVVRVSRELVILPEQAEQIRTIVAELPDGFTIADFRHRTGLSRKYTVPLLEWADSTGLTVRRGEGRWLR